MMKVGDGWSILFLFIFTFPNVPVYASIEEPTKFMNRPVTAMPPSTITPETTTTRNGTGSQTICADFENAVECNKYSTCGFDLCKSICVERSGQECSKDSYLTKCRRGNSWYAVCGMLCKSHNGKDKGKCKPKGVTIAVNLNGPALPEGDSKRVPHEADAINLYNDTCPTTTRGEIDDVTAWCKNGITGINEKDRELYNTLIYGRDEGRGSGKCNSYRTNITKDGRYEFNLRLVEPAYMCYGRKQQRHFNVRLNGELVLPELEILLYVSHCQGMDLFTEFDVRNGYLTLAGIQSSKISNDGLVLVQFCYGDGEPGLYYDPSYVVASFYIVELAPNDKPMPTLPTTVTTELELTTTVMEATTDKQTMTTHERDMDTTTDHSVALTTITPNTPGPTPTLHPGGIFCRSKNKESICHCLDPHNRCDAIYQPGGAYGDHHCVKRLDFCHDLDDDHFVKFFPPGSCMRARATYSYGGLICNNEYKSSNDDNFTKDDFGTCDIRKTIIAVRFNGNDTYTDARNVSFVPMSQRPPKNAMDYEFNFNTLASSKGTITVCHELTAPKKVYGDTDRDMWIHYVTGKEVLPGPLCFNYSVPIEEDGTYELSVKTIEYESGEKDERAFNIFLNGIHVFREIQPIKIWQAICVAIDLISGFEVTGGGTMVTPRGFPTYPIQKGGLEVAFCNGQCTIYARKKFNFIGVAFSVVQLNPQ